MAESAITFMFNQLSIWLQEEEKLLGGLRQEAELLHGQMGQMRAFLRVADAKEESDPQIKEWVGQVREIAYDTEDVLERYMLRFACYVDAYGFNGHLKEIYALVKNLRARHQIASEVKAIRSRLENASNTFRGMNPAIIFSGSASSSNSNTGHDSRGDALLLEEVDIVGIEKPKKQLLEWLSSTDCGFKVIAVVGMAGLGKTTLVKKVYDDLLVKNKFDHHAWATVSESFKIENLLEDITKRLLKKVKQLSPQRFEARNADGMREFIYNFLQNKNYVIVLDDMWTIDVWEAVRYAFPRSNTNGRGCIIITTRFNNIGNAACSESNGPIYKLEPLHEEESRELFYKKAFRGKSCPPYLTEISERILKRCEGWPLAIVVIGGLLATKNDKIEEWEMFHRSLGFELQGGNLKRLSKLLSLSFDDLPYYLKACFLYLSIFPKDQVIKKGMVIHLWIAEGFVEGKQGKTIEEIAEGYLYELLNRSLIQIVGAFDDGRPREFRVHDLIREYITSKAREQNIATIDSGGEIQWPDRIRRLALHSSTNYTVQPIWSYEYLRSLLFLDPLGWGAGQFLHEVLQNGCRMLKVLDSRGEVSLYTIPSEVYKLYHLKHLTLRYAKVQVIPKSIGNLRKLETLDLKWSRVTELPIEILKLKKLRNLLVYTYDEVSVKGFNAPYEMGRLSSLVKLCYIDASTAEDGQIKIVKEIGKLSGLRRLGITKLRREDGKVLCSSLRKLANLRSLKIVSFDDGKELMDLDYSLSPVISEYSSLPFLRTLRLQGHLERVPQWVSSLNALTTLVLGKSRLRDNPLECLQHLPNLVELQMVNAYEGEGLSFKAGGFQRLRELYLSELRRLRWVRVEKGSMPFLHEFVMWDCKSMVEVPMGIEHLTTLQALRFINMTDEFGKELSDEKTKEGNQWKLAHVLQVWVVRLVDGEWVPLQL